MERLFTRMEVLLWQCYNRDRRHVTAPNRCLE